MAAASHRGRRRASFTCCSTRTRGRCRRAGDVSSTIPAILPVVSSSREPLAMLVGQAPGKTEVVEPGRPFAGRAGKTLFRWFAEVGIAEPCRATTDLHRRHDAMLSRVESDRPRRSPPDARAGLELLGRGWRRRSHYRSSRSSFLWGDLRSSGFSAPVHLAGYVGRAHGWTSLLARRWRFRFRIRRGQAVGFTCRDTSDLVRSSLRLIAARLPQLALESERVRSVA